MNNFQPFALDTRFDFDIPVVTRDSTPSVAPVKKYKKRKTAIVQTGGGTKKKKKCGSKKPCKKQKSINTKTTKRDNLFKTFALRNSKYANKDV